MDHDAADVSVGDVAFACVEPDTNANISVTQRPSHRGRALDGASGRVEQDDEPVSGGLDFPAAEHIDLSANDRVMGREHPLPVRVA